MAKVKWSAKAAKQLLRIDSRYVKPITKKVGELSAFPDVILDLKKLTGKGAEYRLRVGDYRVMFEVIDGAPVVIEITQVSRRQSKTY
ncbi:type II toxin-antitoxin system RelE/ParE family toxin [Pantoea sp. CCBC3-3-1]|uniref:type II toxin-antitoxin system RelE family toxin n=1 Tax=Pantoea sp. CCBC3-3-1 TaxID=2490851 RepID=UPI0011BEEE99|nr:type II toxin-antitoxin system RelE/ParE family toxin [Pantoea sp. CCBC3-3-1]